MQSMCKETYKFKVYVSWDRKKGTYSVKSVNIHHRCRKDMLRNRQIRSSRAARHYILKLKETPEWSVEEIQSQVKKDFRICITIKLPTS